MNSATSDIRELNTLITSYFTTTLIEMFKEFKRKLTNKYASDLIYEYIIKILNNNENAIKLPFI